MQTPLLQPCKQLKTNQSNLNNLYLKREELETSSSFKIYLENRSIPFTNESEKFIIPSLTVF